ncbi:MAG TPA: IS481 family transposase [Methylomusa anaerophila]|uniref:Integrase core domain protein n=1 Tax=Methylomusa anaerophila TaxID=1930071 RepID=A0A348AM46_9FIRM|nr:helix-turn-helix domain-containing protein [Methylomusa anaerophila]BBB92144.1 integrase core domain protein [Methylomusa anaerophila]HML87842.1 IS481 family transposase [Methylomusa anaerophila]
MKERETDLKDPVTKAIQRRVSVLQLAEVLGNVSEACRCSGMNRTSFYEWKKRFQTQGIEGLKNLPPIHRTHPQRTPPAVEAKVIAASLDHPDWGCLKLEACVKSQGIHVSSTTIQKILLCHNLGSRPQRWLRLEKKYLMEGLPLNSEAVRKIEQYNPCFKERYTAVNRPGELLAQDSFYVGTLSDLGQIYLHAVVDMYNSFAFGLLYAGRAPKCAVAVLRNQVLPFFREKKIPVGAVVTDNGREFYGKETHYENFLALNGVKHRRPQGRNPKTNGFIERFKRTVLKEFFLIAFQNKFYNTVEGLQADFDVWLAAYNYERPHLGYRNFGKRPIDMIND